MSKNEIALTAEQIFGTETVILTAQGEQYEYVDGKKTDKISGCRFTVVSPMRNFQTFNVKIEGGKLLSLTEEEIDEACSSMKPIWVNFVGFKAKPYTGIKGIAYSCSAEAVKIADMDVIDI